MDRVVIQTYHERHGGLPGETATLVDDARETELQAQEAEHEVVLCFLSRSSSETADRAR